MNPTMTHNSNVNTKLGDIKEIEVSKPDIRLSKELKEKLQSLNQLAPNLHNKSHINEFGDLDPANKLLKMNRGGTQALETTMNASNYNMNMTKDNANDISLNLSAGSNSYLVRAG